jgi:hypothetical protein
MDLYVLIFLVSYETAKMGLHEVIMLFERHLPCWHNTGTGVSSCDCLVCYDCKEVELLCKQNAIDTCSSVEVYLHVQGIPKRCIHIIIWNINLVYTSF